MDKDIAKNKQLSIDLNPLSAIRKIEGFGKIDKRYYCRCEGYNVKYLEALQHEEREKQVGWANKEPSVLNFRYSNSKYIKYGSFTYKNEEFFIVNSEKSAMICITASRNSEENEIEFLDSILVEEVNQMYEILAAFRNKPNLISKIYFKSSTKTLWDKVYDGHDSYLDNFAFSLFKFDSKDFLNFYSFLHKCKCDDLVCDHQGLCGGCSNYEYLQYLIDTYFPAGTETLRWLNES